MQLSTLQSHLDDLLDAGSFKDYSPNGLQVEGRAEVRRVLCGVTASQALLDKAVAGGVDAVCVHHGYFWRGEDACITGIRKRRLTTLLKHDISLLAYHLPLDAHPTLGNNAELGRLAGWSADGHFGPQNLGWIGSTQQALTAQQLQAQLSELLSRDALLVGGDGREIRRIAWCTGGAQGFIEQAIAAGADAYVSGEISEPTAHLARESGVAYLAAGHHATERYGIQAVGRHLNAEFGIETEFVDIDNPA